MHEIKIFMFQNVEAKLLFIQFQFIDMSFKIPRLDFLNFKQHRSGEARLSESICRSFKMRCDLRGVCIFKKTKAKEEHEKEN